MMVQQLRALAGIAEDLGLFPSRHLEDQHHP